LSTSLLTQPGKKTLLLLPFSICLHLIALAQIDTLLLNDTISKKVLPDSLIIPEPQQDSIQFGLSPNAIKSRVDYKSTDSIRLDVKSQKVYMYYENDISYEDINLKANYIEIEFNNNTVYATGTKDSIGKDQGRPVFKMGDNSFESESIKYNYETKKGLVKKVITEDAQGYLHGNTVKKMPDDVTNVYEGSYTTCEHEDPHFAFNFKRAKVIPDKKIITGPANLVIEDVPTPLFIPFGMFPNKKGQRSGIVIPTYGESAQRGFYFENCVSRRSLYFDRYGEADESS